jgi:RHS repeat-associated protein
MTTRTIQTAYLLTSAIFAVRNGSAVTSLHGDHLGSVSVTTGASTSSQTFLPWGTVRSGSVSATKRNYTGQYRDDTGLLYYHARYYDPALGRFISPDTIVPDPTDPQDLNRYTYAKNNPMRYTDPTGHSIPIQCFICDVEFADISEWSHPAIALAEVGCLVVGCHVDRTQGVIRGPTREEWVAGQAAGFMPAGVVAKPAAVAGGGLRSRARCAISVIRVRKRFRVC